MILNRPPFRFLAPEPGDDGAGSADFGDDVAVDDEPVIEAKEEPVIEAKAKETPKDEEGEGDEGKPRRQDTRIPLARHKELLAKERELRNDLERQLAQHKGGQDIAATNASITADEKTLIGLEREYAKLITDGDHAKAAEAMTQIRKLERGISETKSQFLTAAAEARAYERVRYDMTVERVEAAFPVINPDHDDYDQGMADEVLELKGAYQMKGYTSSQALQKAAKVLLGAETRRQTAAVETEARPDKEDVAKAVSAERKKTAVARNLETDKKQPKAVSALGADSDRAGAGIVDPKAIMQMKHADFVKLSEAELAKLRGDAL